MSNRIGSDHSRFKDIVKRKVRESLHKYISNDEMLGRVGKDTVSIPIPQIDLPRFRFGPKQQGGVGTGKGEIGDSVGGEEGDEEGDGGKKAGKDEGQHGIEVDVTFDELADMLGEELQLPKIENKGKDAIIKDSTKYTGISRVGPGSLRHIKRTYKQTLRRAIATGNYNPDNPVLIPVHDDWRYRAPETTMLPIANAVVIYMMDVSGSMGDEQKEIVRTESFWIDLWLRRQYKGIKTRFIIHDAGAREVDRHTFFHTRESGGTMISSAYKLCAKIIEQDYPSSEWNIYPFHFSDGDNWSMDDSLKCFDIMANEILPKCNVFGYGQVTSPYGSGQFLTDIRDRFGKDDRVALSEISDRGAIQRSIKDFFGKGK